MIVHSTGNTLGDTCVVQIEGIEHGTTDDAVKAYAEGAAGKHNAGYQTRAARVVWLDEDGKALGAHLCSSESEAARVIVRIEAP